MGREICLRQVRKGREPEEDFLGLMFGNHDEEDGEAKRDQLRYIQGLSYSLVQAGPTVIHGVLPQGKEHRRVCPRRSLSTIV